MRCAALVLVVLACPVALAQGESDGALAALDDPSAVIRRDACRALGKRSPLPAGAIDALLARVITDESGVVRASAAWALGRAGEQGRYVVPALIASPESDTIVRRARFWAIHQLDPDVTFARFGPPGGSPLDVRPVPASATASLQSFVEGACSGDEKRRDDSFKSFGERGAPSLEPVTTLLGHANAAVRISAARTIEFIHANDSEGGCGVHPTEWFIDPTPAQYETVVPALIPLLGDADAEVRLAGASALGTLAEHGRTAASALSGLLDDPAPDVRSAAAGALGSIGVVDRPTSERLLAMLARDEDASSRENAASACRHHPQNERVIPALWAAATDDVSPAVRLAALWSLFALKESPTRCATTVTTHVLTTGDDHVLREAFYVLEQLGRDATPAVDSLIALAREAPDEDVREQASRTLCVLVEAGAPSERAVDELLRRIEAGDPDPMEALAKAHIVAAIEPIGRWLQRQDPSERGLAVEALAEFGAPAAPLLVATLARDLPCDELEQLTWALWRVGPAAAAAAPRLVELAADASRPDELRQEALWALAGVGSRDPQVVAALERLLGSDDTQLRLHAGEVLGELGPIAATSAPALVEWLTSDDEDLVATAAQALGLISAHARVVVPALADLLRHPSHDVRESAARALARFGAASRPALDALVAALDDESSEVRRDAALALAAIGAEAAVAAPGLSRAVEDEDPGVRPAARLAMAAIADDAARAVARLVVDLDDPDARVSESAALALGQLGGRASGAVPALIRRLDSFDAPSAEALGRIGPPGLAAPALEAALEAGDDDDDEFIRAARRALRDLR